MQAFARDEILTEMCIEYMNVMRDFGKLTGQLNLKKEEDSQSFKECVDVIDKMTQTLFARISFYEKFGVYKN